MQGVGCRDGVMGWGWGGMQGVGCREGVVWWGWGWGVVGCRE